MNTNRDDWKCPGCRQGVLKDHSTCLTRTPPPSGDGLPPPAAYCAPDNPFNTSAFSWPGSDRRAAHTMALYTADQVQTLLQSAQVGGVEALAVKMDRLADSDEKLSDTSPEFTANRQRYWAKELRRLAHPQRDENKWSDAVLGMLVARRLIRPEHLDSPRTAIADLLASEQQPASAAVVTDEILILASNAYFDNLPVHGGLAADPDALRAALTAAFNQQADKAGNDDGR